jgi:2-oxoglutarate dehydrogenase E1 component
MLLPHGYQGLGPEHSSARLERFLQCSNEDEHAVVPPERQLQLCNWQVVNPTTPANYFHVLRRQVCRQFRKPLIVASTKSLLRHKLAVASFADLSGSSKFHRVLPEAYPEELVAANKVKRVVLCSGKLYYELLDKRREQKNDSVAIVRLEQLSPFPSDLVAQQLAAYPKAECVWAQEEPMNMGAWQHVHPRIVTASNIINGKLMRPRYVGREPMAATAEGTSAAHQKGQDEIIRKALDLSA